jgi:hypothetical protein|tara:strand:+ start:1080 stop:1538 length:459 start_codon:yes stop_codon:yes gene_type:complete
MAIGSIYRFPKKTEDGTIKVKRKIKTDDGGLEDIDEIIFSADSPTLGSNFTDEINSLIESGEIKIPGADIVNSYIIDISHQLQEGKYTYNFVNDNSDPVECDKIYRIFFNGLNVSEDVTLSEDRMSFTFIDLYGDAIFGMPESRLVIDFIAK